jgi:hypothetical protein
MASRVLLDTVRDTAARELAAADSRVYEFSVTTFPLGGPSLVLLIASRTQVNDAESATALPGQALGYLVGQREILRLREDARSRLGAAFDIRDFHSAILDHGSLPLAVLGQVVAAWADSAADGGAQRRAGN